MDHELTAPRDLTEDETSTLRERLKSKLITISSSADDEEDAEALVEYAFDMIEGGESIGHVIEELKFMEMPLCDEETADKLGICVTEFFKELDGGAEKKKKTWAKIETPSVETDPPPSPRAQPPALPPSPVPSRPPVATPENKKTAESSNEASDETSAAAVADADAGPNEKKTSAEGAESSEPTHHVEPAAPRPSLAARAASFRSSSYVPPASFSSSVGSSSSSSSSRRTSWAAPKTAAINNKKEESSPRRKTWSAPKKIAAGGEKKDESSEKTPREETEEEQESKAETEKHASLKDRLAAYQQGASSRKVAQAGNKNDAWLKEHLGASKRSNVSVKNADKGDDKDGGDSKKEEKDIPRRSEVEDAAPGLSLKERMAAFQHGSKLATTEEEKEDGDEDEKKDNANDKEEEDVKKEEEEAPRLSLKDRMAAFQVGSPTKASKEEGEDPLRLDQGLDEEEEKEEDTLAMSLKNRMAAYQRGKSASAKKEPTLKKRMSAYQPPAKGNSALQDRMAVFGKAKTSATAPKKELSDLQQRMAKFSATPSSSTTSTTGRRKSLPPPKKVQLPNGEGGGCGGLKDRLAKYAETAAPGAEVETFVAPKKKPAAKPKPKTFVPKKPKGNLQARMQKFNTSLDKVPEDEEAKKEQPAVVVPRGDLKGRLSMYQANGNANEKKEQPAVVVPGGGLKGRLSAYQAHTGPWKKQDATPIVLGRNEEQPTENEAPTVPEINEGQPTENEKEPTANDDEQTLSAVMDDSSPEASEEKKSDEKSDGGATDIVEASESEKSPTPENPAPEEVEWEDFDLASEARKLDEDTVKNSGASLEKDEATLEEDDAEEEGRLAEESVLPDETKVAAEDEKATPVEESSPGAAEEEDAEDDRATSPDAAEKEELGDEGGLLDESEGEVQDEEAAPVEVLSPANSVDSEGFSEFRAFLRTNESDAPSGPAPAEESAEDSQPEVEGEREEDAEDDEADLETLKSQMAAMEAERARARLESLEAKLAEAKQTLERSLGRVESFAREVKEHELDAGKAEMAMLDAQSKSKKMGLASKAKKKARKEAYEAARGTYREELKRVRRAKVRLSLATEEADVAKMESSALRKKCERAEVDLRQLLSGVPPSEREEQEAERAPPFPEVRIDAYGAAAKGCSRPGTDEGTATASWSSEPVSDLDAFLDSPN